MVIKNIYLLVKEQQRSLLVSCFMYFKREASDLKILIEDLVFNINLVR